MFWFECLRGSLPAAAWLRRCAAETFAVPGVVAMELVMGCRDRTDLQLIEKFLRRFVVVWPEAPEFAKAYNLLTTHRLSAGVSIPDCLIAAMVLARGARLYTFNLKHFEVVAGLDVEAPYPRS